jgi:hypothetical protein
MPRQAGVCPPLPAALVRWCTLSQKDNVSCGCRDFFFVPSPFSQKNFRKKAFPPRVILRAAGEMPMSRVRLGVIALIMAMIFNGGIAVAEPNQTSADYVMSGCRDAATLITFSNVRESEEDASRMGFCAGIVVGLSFMGQPYGICVPAGTTAQQATSIVVQYIDGQPARETHEDFNSLAVEALRANWPCSVTAGARDPLAVALH